MKMRLRLARKPQRIIIFAVAITATLAMLYMTSGVPLLARTFGPRVAPQSPTISVLPQPDVPLRISSVGINAANPFEPQIDFAVENTSNKLIRAFTIRQDDMTERMEGSSGMLNHMTSLDQLLQPMQLMTLTSVGGRYAEPVKSIVLSVDFVEFVDGSIWGADTYQSAERLAGQRAGARAAKDHLSKKAGNPPALLNAVAAGEADVDPPPGHSPSWEEGFRTGTGVMRERLQKAKSKGGLAEVKHELKQPYDAAEGRPKQ